MPQGMGVVVADEGGQIEPVVEIEQRQQDFRHPLRFGDQRPARYDEDLGPVRVIFVNPLGDVLGAADDPGARPGMQDVEAERARPDPDVG